MQSDALPALKQLLHDVPQLAVLGKILKVRIVVDANAILGDLYWLHKKRTNPIARPSLREVIQSGVVVAFAPPALHDEVVAHFPEYEERYGIRQVDLRASWAEYRSMFTWLPPRPGARVTVDTERDPTDAPYAALAVQIGAAAVYTKDRDYESFDVVTLGASVILDLRSYARSTASVMTIKIVGVGTVAVSVRLIPVLFAAAARAWTNFRRLPQAIQLAVMAGMICAALHEPTRRWIAETARAAGASFLSAISSIVDDAALTLRVGGQQLAGLNLSHLVDRSPRALADYAAIVCAENRGHPLMLHEIIEAARQISYSSKAKNPQRYLAQVLRRDERFHKLHDGRWTLAPAGLPWL